MLPEHLTPSAQLLYNYNKPKNNCFLMFSGIELILLDIAQRGRADLDFEQVGHPNVRFLYPTINTKPRTLRSELEDGVAQPELKLVPRQNEEQRSTYPTRQDGFFHSWFQEAQGLSRLLSILVFLLFSTLVMAGFQFLWNKFQVLSAPTPTSSSPEYVASSTLQVFSKPGLIKKNRVGACEAGTRARVIGTATVDGQVWYEIEILSQHPANIDSAKPKWVLASRLVMARS